MESFTLDNLKNLMPADMKIRAVAFRALQVSYSNDEGLELKGHLKKRPVKVTIDKDGKVSSSTKLGALSIKQTSEFQAIGANFKKLNVTFRLLENGDVAYDGWFTAISGLGFGINGTFDLERMILDRGLLRGAYRPLKNRQQDLKDAIDGIK